MMAAILIIDIACRPSIVSLTSSIINLPRKSTYFTCLVIKIVILFCQLRP